MHQFIPAVVVIGCAKVHSGFVVEGDYCHLKLFLLNSSPQVVDHCFGNESKAVHDAFNIELFVSNRC